MLSSILGHVTRGLDKEENRNTERIAEQEQKGAFQNIEVV
jgi:hypothetical protein